jgi:MFS family permease
MRAFAAYRGLLSNRPLALLLVGEFISAIGDWLYVVAILIVVYREAADPLVLGLFGAARILPYVLLSVPAGFVADRFDRRLVLLATDLLRGACMLAMAGLVAADGPVLAIAAFAVLATCGSAFFYPAIGSYIPALVRDERDLAPANGLFASLDNLGYVIGPALGGLLVAGGGATFAFLINAATFGVIAAILWRLPPSIAGSPEQPADVPMAAEGSAGPVESAESRPAQRFPWRPRNIVEDADFGSQNAALTVHLPDEFAARRLLSKDYRVAHEFGQPRIAVQLVEEEFEICRLGGNLCQHGFRGTRRPL